MKKETIIIFTLLILHLATAQEININSPDEVIYKDEFEINLELINFTEDIYDVKIDILNESKHIARVFWKDKWQSSTYWMEKAFNLTESNNKNFQMKITEKYNGENKIIVKLRNSTNSWQFEKSISIKYEEDEIFELYWDEDEIVNGEKFEIEIKAENLKEKDYDLEIWIEKDNEKISEFEWEEEWKTGKISDFLTGPDKETRDIKMRIQKDDSDVKGDALLICEIDNEKIEYDIEILEDDGKEIIPEISKPEETQEIQKPESEKIIKLGKSQTKTTNSETENIKSEIVYENKSEIINKSLIFAFALFCVILSLLISWEKLE